MFNGKKLAHQRKLMGLSQEQLAKRLNVSMSSIAMYETNKRQPDNETIINMANLFGVTTDYLLDHDDTSTSLSNATEDKELNKKILQMAQDEFDRTLFKKYGHLSEEKKELRKLGLGSHSPYDCRHTFATLMSRAKADDHCIKLIMGHRIDDITKRVYTHKVIEDLIMEVNKI